MKTVQVRNITIGEGRPKICVPIVGQTKEDILLEAGTFARIPVDVVEWRVDWDEDIFVDTNDVWDDGDRVGITIAPQNIRIVQSLNKEGSAQ